MEIRKTLESIVLLIAIVWLGYSYLFRDKDTAKRIAQAEQKADTALWAVEKSQKQVAELSNLVVRMSDTVDVLKAQNYKTSRDIQAIEQRYQTRKKKQDVIIRATLDSIKTQFKQLQNESSYHFPFYHHPLVQRWLLPVRYGFDDEG